MAQHPTSSTPLASSAVLSNNLFEGRGAFWIWCPEATRPYHNVVCFGRKVAVGKSVRRASVFITADARYDLYINGHWVGQGPPRAWPSPWPVDHYDIARLLQPGENTIAVLVQDWRLSTFQYCHQPPGLLGYLEIEDQEALHVIPTDPTWRARPHDGYLAPAPRISCMQAWEEQFDARVYPGERWMFDAFDGPDWQPASVTGPAGSGVHASFELRTIPHLTHDAVAPTRVVSVEAVRPATYTWNVNPRDYLNANDKSANHIRGRMLLVSHIYSETAQPVQFHQPHGRPRVGCQLNGAKLTFDDFTQQKTDTGVAHTQLSAGWNTLVARLPEVEHYWWMTINAWTERPVRWSAYPDDRTLAAWSAIGPFAFPPEQKPSSHRLASPAESDAAFVEAEQLSAAATASEFDRIWTSGRLTPTDLAQDFVRALREDMVTASDAYATSASDRPTAIGSAQVDDPHALLHDNEQWTTIHPRSDGTCTRFLLDFSREVIGRHEIEVDAPAGAVIDVHNFEFIQPDGRYNLAEGMNNSFRYICREGVQRYCTLLRRGFRYSWLTVRGLVDRPLRIRQVRVRMSTYPQQRQGEFSCSDPLLEQIWEAGARSVECCSEDTYTDCPTFEQTFWVGDGRNEALVDLVVNGDPRLSAHSWKLAAQSLERSPIVESQVPSGWVNVLPAWSFLWMRWAQEHYMLTGDRAFAREALTSLDLNVRGVEQHRSSRGLFKFRGWNMFDWAQTDSPAEGEVTHLNCFAVLGLRHAISLADDLGERGLAERWARLAGSLTAAINTHLWDNDAQAYIDCIHADGRRSTVLSQQTHTTAYISGVPTDDRKQRCWQLMTAPPEGYVTAGSPFFMSFLLEGLVREDRHADLLQTIRSYWGKQIAAGATTFWETYAPDAARLTRSHCHGWSAAPTFFLTQHVLGVRPATAGYRVVEISPCSADVQWARGTVPTPFGVVRCNWRIEKGARHFDLTLPSDVVAQFKHNTAESVEMLAGHAAARKDAAGATLLELTGPSVRFVVRN